MIRVLLLVLALLPTVIYAQTGDLQMVPETGGGGGSSLETSRHSVGQTAHGFTSNQWLMFNQLSSEWELLDSTSITNDIVGVGFVRSVEDVNNFTLSVAGAESWVHGLSTGPLFASSTPGVLTDTPPPLGTIHWMIAIAGDTGSIIIFQMEWIQL